jgi:hypothetical protein
MVPAADLWKALSGPAGVFAFHLHLMAHPAPLPERMIGADSDGYFGHFLDAWVTDPAAIPPDVRAAYLAAARTPEAIHAICADYRSGAFVDGAHDEDDRASGKQLRMPVMALWHDPGKATLPFDFNAVWKAWAPDLRTVVLDGGHLLPGCRPHQTAAALRAMIDQA